MILGRSADGKIRPMFGGWILLSWPIDSGQLYNIGVELNICLLRFLLLRLHGMWWAGLSFRDGGILHPGTGDGLLSPDIEAMNLRRAKRTCKFRREVFNNWLGNWFGDGGD
jgi:hypothetical protein